MKITFILPMYLSVPSGGFKVVYEYANRLQQKGHEITLVHPRNIDNPAGFKQRLKSHLWKYKLRLRVRRLANWFDFDEHIQFLLVRDLSESHIPDADFIFATAFETAFPVIHYSAQKGRKLYLIQSYEDWNGDALEVERSWKLPLYKIVISRWLQQLAYQFGEAVRTTYIPIGLDLSTFKLKTPIESRKLPRIAMLAHPHPVKGTADGLRALELIKKSVPALEAILFGTGSRDSSTPEWIAYHRLPSEEALCGLYNKSTIFLQPSIKEGWGLTAAEAMACGCALVTTDNQGVREFATDGETALFSPAGSPELLAQNAIKLICNDELRQRLAQQGQRNMQAFTWDRSADSLERLLLQLR